MLCVAQLNRAIESRQKFIPKMSDVKESGAFEQDADVILFCVWPHRVDAKKDPNEYNIYIAKNRNRAINKPAVRCQFNPSRQKFSDAYQPPVRFVETPERVSEFDEWNNS
jgi:replicative DNA helicase